MDNYFRCPNLLDICGTLEKGNKESKSSLQNCSVLLVYYTVNTKIKYCIEILVHLQENTESCCCHFDVGMGVGITL